ncbi:hypothetical protein AAVH_17485 [Aphelenchoides avenae]|nr:hypothetical protein AAVH_17485 [Aphelenchus avenae]
MTPTNLQPSTECHDAGTSTDSPEPPVEITEPVFVDTLNAERPTPADDLELNLVDEIATEDTAKTQALIVSDCTITGWEPLEICTPKEGRHRTCRPLHVQEHFNTDYVASTTAEIRERDRHRLFGRQVPTVLQSLLILWAARLISGHAKAVVKFINQLLDSRPEEAVRIWEENYDAVTENIQWFPAIISRSDLRLALRKRAYSCDVACNNLLANDENGSEPYFCTTISRSLNLGDLVHRLQSPAESQQPTKHYLHLGGRALPNRQLPMNHLHLGGRALPNRQLPMNHLHLGEQSELTRLRRQAASGKIAYISLGGGINRTRTEET